MKRTRKTFLECRRCGNRIPYVQRCECAGEHTTVPSCTLCLGLSEDDVYLRRQNAARLFAALDQHIGPISG